MVCVVDSQKWKEKTVVLVMLFCYTNGGWLVHSLNEGNEMWLEPKPRGRKHGTH